MSHSDSPASTVRGSDSGAADDAARAGFLAGALSRLGLTSPAPANQEAQPARPPGAQEGNTSAPPPRKSPEQKRKENKRRNQRRKEARRRRREEEAEKAQQQQQPVDPLGSWTSLSGAVDWSEDAHSVFGSEVTVSLLSHDDAVSYASSIVLASLIPGGSTVPFSKRSTADKLAFYQSLVLQFSTFVAVLREATGVDVSGGHPQTSDRKVAFLVPSPSARRSCAPFTSPLETISTWSSAVGMLPPKSLA